LQRQNFIQARVAPGSGRPFASFRPCEK
jgi:hypothetical protein